MKYSHILLSLSLAILLASCEESAPSLSTNVPTLDPVEVEDNGGLVFILKATIPNTSTASECGFYVSDNISMTNAAQYPSKLTGSTFTAEVTLQGYNRNYYVCSYISNGKQEILSEAKTISIGPIEDYVTFESISLDSYDSETEVASFSTTCSIADGVEVTKYGILWGASEDLKSSGTSKELTFPGSGKSVTFELPNLKLGERYYLCQYLTDSDVTIYGKTETFKASPEWDLSATESANCYIIASEGKYRFKTVKGNSTTSVGNVSSCEVLWETFGTSTTPQSGDLIPYAAYNDEYISFAASSSKGNAVIAAKDASGNILWSWHIWLTDIPQGQEYNNNAGVMMDRNLGATSATPGDVGALGLLYQWGARILSSELLPLKK
ncbi:MAG: hypothetical protein ACI3Z0_09305 [Candidatus Cryptobacteroides sp.]